jgi:putative ABC transport system permease protein
MFFIVYLGRELRRRARQSVFIMLGLALGVGLVVTVMAAASGVQQAQGSVLQGLYGIGTDVTVSVKPPPFNPNANKGMRITMTPSGAQVCDNGHCTSGAQKIDTLTGSQYAPMSYSAIAAIGKLDSVAGAGGGLVLTDQQMTIPSSVAAGGALPTSNSFGVDGVDFTHSRLGPFSQAKLSSGRDFTAADQDSDVALVDSDYASAHSLKPGSTITIAKTPFKVIGVVSQPQGSQPPDVYIPLGRAQALATSAGKGLQGDINSVYVTAASAADIPAVQREISKLLPSATVTSPSSLASQVTGSLASTARLADDLGRWLSVLVLITAFAVTCLLTMAAVARRVREFGTLKALGWRNSRIIAQVMGEAAVTGIIGGLIGAALGFAGAAIINHLTPPLTAIVATPTGQHLVQASPSGTQVINPTVTKTVPVLLSASVTGDALALGIALAIGGALLAGSFGSWRIAQLRPADALARVA